MTNEGIFRKAIAKVKKTKPDFMSDFDTNCPWLLHPEYNVIFDHAFAKAFWGTEEEIVWNHESLDGQYTEVTKPAWQYHLQQMVLEEDPIKYLEKFL